MRAFITIPFFRLMIPFVSGILLAIYGHAFQGLWMYLMIILIIASVLVCIRQQIDSLKITLLVIMDIFIFLYGMALCPLTDKSVDPFFYGSNLRQDSAVFIIAYADDLPLEKEKSIKCSMKILEMKDTAGFKRAEGQMIVYLRKSLTSRRINPGDVLLIKTVLQAPQPPKNPFEFNYQVYLRNRQIFHTAFIDSSAFVSLGAGHFINPVWLFGLKCKAYILWQLKHSSLDINSYAICAALLTGYDDEIDKSVMDAFSHSGTLHVLSVSGLHTGLIYLVLGYLFDLVDRKKKYRFTRFMFITIILWSFALITGFSSPVLRAVIMFNLLGLGKIFFRGDYRNQMNILLVSAFLLLTYNPWFITDVGFQLSYFALAGLIYFQPGMLLIFNPVNPMAKSVWQSVAASFSATLSTLPLTLFYFKQFPLWFFICNLVVVPATFIILLLGVLVVMHINIAAIAVNYLIRFLIFFIEFFNNDQLGFVDMISFTLIDGILFPILIVLLSLTLQYRSYKAFATSFVILIAWQCLSLSESVDAKKARIFTSYFVNRKDVFSVKDGARVIYNDVPTADFNFHVKPHFISFINPSFTSKPFNFIHAEHQDILILDKPEGWPEIKSDKITTLVLCNNFVLTETELKQFKKLTTVVCSGSNNNSSNKKTRELCRKFGLGFYLCRDRGAYLIAL